MFARLLRDFGMVRVAEMAGEDKQDDPDEHVKEAFTEIRQVVTGQGDEKDPEEEDDETCGFCIFMKAGGCKKEFTDWSKCVDTKRGDGHNFTEECRDPTLNLQQCMEEHRDYYQDFMMDMATLKDEDSGDRSVQPASPDEQQSDKKDIKGNTEANKQSKVPEDHDSSSGTENPNKGKSGTSEQGGDKQKESSGEQEPTNGAKKDKGGDAESKNNGGANGEKKDDTGSKDKPKAPEGKTPEEPHSEQKQSDKHDIKGHTEANKQVKVSEDHDSSSGTKDNRSPEEKEPQETHDGHVVDDGASTQRGAAVGASASAIDGDKDGGEDGGEGEDEEEEKPTIEIKTASYDARFPATNQARHCYTRYNEYHRCVAQKGEGADECRVFQRAYRSLCPGEWLERWNEQREEGTWPGRY
ncbi:hypothetical protein CVIRNUC_005177 [Coccomyxa viridis]|uniref:GCK domain-containing protein n=1 Tax=Coccomyxa viridis TaxID=1274662 RepID=A0AAV1I7S8_9CHLO|nr:hypothetical protein CVIRNUC_005177 [Coccomyxa viridis]